MSVLTAPPIAIEMPSNPLQLPPTSTDNKEITNNPSSSSTAGWGSYLYQNLILPALTPNTAAVSEWLNLNTPLGYFTPNNETSSNTTHNTHSQSNNGNGPVDYFGGDWNKDVTNLLISSQPQTSIQYMNVNVNGQQSHPSRSQSLPMPILTLPQQHNQQQHHHQQQQQQEQHAGPSQYYSSQPYFYTSNPNSNSNSNPNQSISTSLLFNAFAGSSSSQPITQPQYISPASIEAVDNSVNMTHSPSPITTAANTPQLTPKRRNKRRLASMDEEDNVSHASDPEHESEVPEGVERDGMIWGMKVENYRALSARERKRVRNRISARTFRAKRKEHLNSLEENMTAKDLQLKLAVEETNRLRQEVKELKNRLARYEVS